MPGEVENLLYAGVQIAHNFGATVVTGGPIVVLAWVERVEIEQRIARLVLGGWLLQVLSGAAFGALSWHYYGQLPEIHGAALAALVLKLCCAVVGIGLGLFCLSIARDGRRRVWRTQAGCAFPALSAAGVLRWFS